MPEKLNGKASQSSLWALKFIPERNQYSLRSQTANAILTSYSGLQSRKVH